MKKLPVFLIILSFALIFGNNAFAEESADRAECMEMTKSAAMMLLEDRETGIAEIAKKDGKFVWKDSYVLLMDMEGNMLAHPFIPQLTTKGSLFYLEDKNKKNPKKIVVEFVDIANTNGEGWIGYMWPKPNSRKAVDKFTFIRRVGQTDLLVGAGIYP